MASGTNTPKLDLLRIQDTWQFGDEAFNRFIDDADNKLVGIAHLSSPMHWAEWKESTVYVKGDIVRYPNLKSHQYAVCLVGGTSDVVANIPTNNITGSVFMDNTVKWEVRSLSEAGANSGTIKIWLGGGTEYTRGDAVRYGDALYRAKIDHTSSATFEADENWWQEIYASIRFWKANTYYYLNDTAIYDNNIYKCIRAHTSVANFEGNPSATHPVVGDEEDWELIGGAGGAKDWATSTKYQVGQLVLLNGILYRCNTKHTSDSTSFSNDVAKWDLVFSQITDWAANKYYVVGNLVAYNNIIYKCLTNHTSDSTGDFTQDLSNWTLYHNTITTWVTNSSYYVGQIVLHNGELYRCNTDHVSTTFVADSANWDVIYAGIKIKHEIDGYVVTRGMNMKATDNGVRANDLAKMVRAAGSDEELDGLGARELNNKEIFNDWTTYTCNSDGTQWNNLTSSDQAQARDSYSFNTANDAIICNRNNDSFSAFISQELYAPSFTVDYMIDNRILAAIYPSLPGDDDGLFFILGFMQDINGNYHTLSVIRNGDSEAIGGTGHGTRFAIVYDLYTSWLASAGSTAYILATNNTLTPHAWDANSYASIRVQKTSSSITAQTSEINSNTLSVTLTYTLPVSKPVDMTQEQYDNIKYMLEHDTRVGFGTQSNPSAFRLTSSLGSLDGVSVYNVNTFKKVYYENGVKQSETPDTLVLLPQEFVYSKLNKRLYFVKSATEIQEIVLNNTIDDWSSENAYVQGAVVNYQGNLYRSTEFNYDSTFNTLKWEFLGAVHTWNSNVYYPYHILCVYEGELYRCILPHTSTSTFVDTNWEKLGGGGGSGSGTGYSQVEAYNVVASNVSPYTINIPIASNATHTLHPTDVLKYKEGQRATEPMMQFVGADKDLFDYDEKYVVFENGVMKINQKVEVQLTPASALGTGYLRMSEDIDLNGNFKSVESVKCS